jgi:hypothetical protein
MNHLNFSLTNSSCNILHCISHVGHVGQDHSVLVEDTPPPLVARARTTNGIFPILRWLTLYLTNIIYALDSLLLIIWFSLH